MDFVVMDGEQLQVPTGSEASVHFHQQINPATSAIAVDMSDVETSVMRSEPESNVLSTSQEDGNPPDKGSHGELFNDNERKMLIKYIGALVFWKSVLLTEQ